jgi:hypothetical protein
MMSEEPIVEELRRQIDNLKLEILAIKEKHHKDQIRDQELRSAQKKSYEAKLYSLDKELQEFKERKDGLDNEIQKESFLKMKQSVDKVKSELDLCRLSNNEY